MTEDLSLFGGPKAVVSALTCSAWPPVRPQDREALQAVLTRVENGSNMWGLFDQDILSLQREWEPFCGSAHAIYTNSGTAALHMAVAASGVQPGSEVIVPCVSFVASATCVLHHNAIPVFADVHPITGLISAEDVARRITPSTKAIIAVHLHGIPADMDALREVARPRGILLIEDSCQAPGARYKGKPTGSLGDMAAFSFNGCKQIAAGEGGMFATSDHTLLERADRLRTFGESISVEGPRTYDSMTLGWMYRSTGLTAALARSQLARFHETMAIRRANCTALDERLDGLEGILLPKVPYDALSARYNYPVVLDTPLRGEEARRYRDRVVEALRAEGVPACVWQRKTLCDQQVIQDGVGYGLGCPWRCPHTSRSVLPLPWPDAQRYVDTYFALDDIQRPSISLEGARELMQQYAYALEKVMFHRERLMEITQ